MALGRATGTAAEDPAVAPRCGEHLSSDGWTPTTKEHPARPGTVLARVSPGSTGSSTSRTRPLCRARRRGRIRGRRRHMGADEVRLSAGKRPSVRWLDDNGEQQASATLVVGADGRRSSIRSQAAIQFEVDPPAHLVAGMLAEGIAGMDGDVNLMARESDLLFFSFPQGAGRARLYFCFPTEQRSRFAGREGAHQFLSTSKLRLPERGGPLGRVRPSQPKIAVHLAHSRKRRVDRRRRRLRKPTQWPGPLDGTPGRPRRLCSNSFRIVTTQRARGICRHSRHPTKARQSRDRPRGLEQTTDSPPRGTQPNAQPYAMSTSPTTTS